MKPNTAVTSALAALPALAAAQTTAIPPTNFGFPSAQARANMTFYQTNGSSVMPNPGDLFGINVPAMMPSVSVDSQNYNGSYLVTLVDPDASYPQNPTARFYLHWLAADFTPDNASDISSFTLRAAAPTHAPGDTVASTIRRRAITNDTAAIVPFKRPAPPTNSSAHRYIFYAFHQPVTPFVLPAAWTGLSDSNRTKFNVTEFIKDANLGTPVAANYFYTSNQSSVPVDFYALAGQSYPGGDGMAVTSGDPVTSTRASATMSTGAGSSSSSAGADVMTGIGGMAAAGLVGLAALL